MTVKDLYELLDKRKDWSSILMWNNMSQFHTNIEDSIPVLYYKRQLPEYISGYRKAEDK